MLQLQKMFIQAGNNDMCERNIYTKLDESRIQYCNNCNQSNHNV